MKKMMMAALLGTATISAAVAMAEPQHEGERGGGGQARQEQPRQEPSRQQPQRQGPSHQAPAGGGVSRESSARVTRSVAPGEVHRTASAASHATQHASGVRAAASGGQHGAVGQAGGGFVYQGRRHQAIRMGGYSYPQGYGYRRWGSGEFLPMLFLSSAYYFDSWDQYGFGAPPYGYRWVRYGPDLLMVDLRTGRVQRVVYGVFY